MLNVAVLAAGTPGWTWANVFENAAGQVIAVAIVSATTLLATWWRHHRAKDSDLQVDSPIVAEKIPTTGTSAEIGRDPVAVVDRGAPPRMPTPRFLRDE